MARVEIVTKKCPVCGYVYKRKQTYDMRYKKRAATVEFGLVFDKSKSTESKVLEELCIEDSVIQGDKDFIYWYETMNNTDLLFEVMGECPEKNTRHCNGIFCPNCGVFLNEKICTKHEIKQI